MAERIYKLQPDRTVQLRGFDHLGASAAVHHATANGFSVSGQFRDAADFAVVVLYDADNFYEHHDLKYLPDFRFDGLKLDFYVTYSGLMPLTSKKYPTIDWPFLDVELASGGRTKVRLSDHASVVATPDEPARAEFKIAGEDLDAWDRVTLWYQNYAFDYVVPGKVRTEYEIYAEGEGHFHSVVIRDRGYGYEELHGDSSAEVAQELRDRINGVAPGYEADPEIKAFEGEHPWMIQLERRLDDGTSVPVNVDGSFVEHLYHVKESTVCRALRDQINAASYDTASTYALQAELDGTTLKIRTTEGGYDTNFLRMYTTSKNGRLSAGPDHVQFGGGTSTAKLHISLDFGALGLKEIRQMWLTLAPRLADSQEYEGSPWSATFENWTLTGPEEVRRLSVAGRDSVRIGSLDGRCSFEGAWQPEDGFFLDNSARVTRVAGASVTVRYHCQKTHDLWLGTSLYGDRGGVSVEVDGVKAGEVNALLGAEPAVVTRRPAAQGVAPGHHVVRLTSLSSSPFYFDYLQAVVAGDVPEAALADAFLTPALDYSTDHAYKLPPARILWILDKLGAVGPLNEYIGIFWWNERKRVGGVMPGLCLEFGGAFTPGDQVFVDIGGQRCGKTVLAAEVPDSIARHFAYLINANYVGVWAAADEAKLWIRARSAAAAYEFPVKAWVERAAESTGTVTGVPGQLTGGSMGDWVVDVEAEHAVNEGARAWHSDFYRLCAASGRAVTTAVSMELVNPPPGFAAQYLDGRPVLTAMGFGGLKSSHCSFSPEMQAFQIRVFTEIAGLMSAAGATPDLQMGEFTWWYFSNRTQENPLGGMAYYDAQTNSAAKAVLGRPLHPFGGPDDDPEVNGGADALFLRNRLRDFAAAIGRAVRTAYPSVKLEILFPNDVNHPKPIGIHQLGGRLNRGVNLPSEWGTKVSSGFDRFKIEALDCGAWSRDLDLARKCMRLPIELGWPPGAVRAMIPVFRGSYPWFREVAYAKDLKMDCTSLWAFDHVCLYGINLSALGVGRAYRFR
ncbi:non-contractile tail sheath protein [Paludibaculum fermentans]|uniref:non-contractile tail sheath protein n=1 Tax=Paludibaculum fermentans TaxID=1473598 RepID=UPI003EBF2085